MEKEKKRQKIWMIIAVIFASILLLYWLFMATDLNEDSQNEYDIVAPMPVD